MKSRLLISMVLLLALGLAAAPQTTKKPLTKDQVMELVKGSVHSARVADLVRENGIDFDPTEEYFRALRSAGAEPVLIDALGAARAVKPPAQDAAAQAKQHIKGANALMDTGDIDGAIALYQKAIQGNPGDSEAHRLLGIALGKKRDWQGDVSEQRVAILLNPDDAAAKSELTNALRSAGAKQIPTDDSRTTSAIKASTKAAAEQAEKAFADGQLQLAHRKFEAAAISFSEAARLKPDWAEPLVERATGALASSVSAALTKSGLSVETPFTEEALKNNNELKYAVADVQRKFDEIAPQLYGKPKDVRKGRFSLGDMVAVLNSKGTADALVIIRSDAQKQTKGRSFMTGGLVGMALSGSATFVSRVVLVDAKNGDILFLGNYISSGIPKETLFEKSFRSISAAK